MLNCEKKALIGRVSQWHVMFIREMKLSDFSSTLSFKMLSGLFFTKCYFGFWFVCFYFIYLFREGFAFLFTYITCAVLS